jgi:hypothetical protein
LIVCWETVWGRRCRLIGSAGERTHRAHGHLGIGHRVRDCLVSVVKKTPALRSNARNFGMLDSATAKDPIVIFGLSLEGRIGKTALLIAECLFTVPPRCSSLGRCAEDSVLEPFIPRYVRSHADDDFIVPHSGALAPKCGDDSDDIRCQEPWSRNRKYSSSPCCVGALQRPRPSRIDETEAAPSLNRKSERRGPLQKRPINKSEQMLVGQSGDSERALLKFAAL